MKKSKSEKHIIEGNTITELNNCANNCITGNIFIHCAKVPRRRYLELANFIR